jgi:hypothetical protein
VIKNETLNAITSEEKVTMPVFIASNISTTVIPPAVNANGMTNAEQRARMHPKKNNMNLSLKELAKVEVINLNCYLI